MSLDRACDATETVPPQTPNEGSQLQRYNNDLPVGFALLLKDAQGEKWRKGALIIDTEFYPGKINSMPACQKTWPGFGESTT